VTVDRPSSRLAGVTYGAVQPFGDQRGSFRELWRESRQPRLTRELAGLANAHFVQVNLSTSAAGVLRGLHYHRRQLDFWVVTSGRAFIALVDVRPAIPPEGRNGRGRDTRGRDTRSQDDPGRPIVETRELATDDWVTIPAGVAHGFLALEPLELVYLVTNEYDGTDELGFAWNDPAVGVPWPDIDATSDGRPILSQRDQMNPPLSEVISRLSAGGGAR
jgi:dTDP-4-dehydrorhamnose 3,5-epimerase